MFSKLGFLFLFSFLIVTPALAFSPTINSVSIPYEVSVIENINLQSEYLGDLVGDPQMYEFVVASSTQLSLTLAQLETSAPIPFSLIVIKQNENRGGVTEVGRLKSSDISWQSSPDKALGLTLIKSQAFTAELSPGTYRVEVSTPENFGKYDLLVGEKENPVGYFKNLAGIYTTQNFFGKSIFSMFKSSYVYYPLGIILMLALIYAIWRQRNLITHKHA